MLEQIAMHVNDRSCHLMADKMLAAAMGDLAN